MVQIWISNLFLCHVFPNAWNTGLVFAEIHSLKQAVSLLWTFSFPWDWAYHGTLFHPGVAQFAFGFYSVMLTSTVLGVATMILFKPRSWCVYCPMGTMTQLICKAKSPKLNDSNEPTRKTDSKNRFKNLLKNNLNNYEKSGQFTVPLFLFRCSDFLLRFFR